MEPLTIGKIVLVTFPFSNLSETRLRPALVLADCERSDWLLCQLTSRPYGDSRAIRIDLTDFTMGTLHRESYARPGKLFTASSQIITAVVAELSRERMEETVDAVIRLLGREPSLSDQS